jgi:hypothetical protein
MKECVICFYYHKICPVLHEHLRLFRLHNPQAVIVPLCLKGTDPLVEGSYVSSARDWPGGWFNADVAFTDWFLSPASIQAKRYFFFEYDTRCQEPLESFYAEVWDAEIARVELWTMADNPDWSWWGQFDDRIPADERAGVCPWPGVMFSQDALRSVCHEVQKCEYFALHNEARIGTAIHRLKIPHREIRPGVGNFLQCSERTPIKGHGIWHPVKKIPEYALI